MTGYVNGGGVVDAMLFDFSKVLRPSPTAFSYKGLVNALKPVWTVGPRGIYLWLHVQVAADNKQTTLRLTRFNVFVNNKSDETECALSKLGGVVNMLSSRDSVQRGLEKLEDWDNIKSMKFSKKCSILHLWQSNLMHQYRWGQPAWLKRSWGSLCTPGWVWANSTLSLQIREILYWAILQGLRPADQRKLLSYNVGYWWGCTGNICILGFSSSEGMCRNWRGASRGLGRSGT